MILSRDIPTTREIIWRRLLLPLRPNQIGSRLKTLADVKAKYYKTLVYIIYIMIKNRCSK